jgi:hypothetical protein
MPRFPRRSVEKPGMKDDNQDKTTHHDAHATAASEGAPPKGFIVAGQYAIAAAQIQVIRYAEDGSVTVTVGRDVLSFEAGTPEAEVFDNLVPRPKPAPAAGAAEGEHKLQQGTVPRR